jgi:hypothetical protein
LTAAPKCKACGAGNNSSAQVCLMGIVPLNEASWKDEVEQVPSELLAAK